MNKPKIEEIYGEDHSPWVRICFILECNRNNNKTFFKIKTYFFF
jgi:hypothetical protein